MAKTMKIFDKLFSGGEENLLKETQGIVKIAIRANQALIKAIEKKSPDISEIHKLERESDVKVFELSNMVSSGAVSPNILDDMLTLIDREDNIVDAIYNLAREMARYNIPNRKLGAMLGGNLLSALQLNAEALEALEKMQSSDSISEMRLYRKRIEVVEEKGDEIKDSLLDYAYRHDMDYKSFIHITEAAHKADNILDSCEDSSDMFLSIMLSIMT